MLDPPTNSERAAAVHDLLEPERLTRIVDVGANPLDVPPYATLREMGLCEIWGFEPQEDAYWKLTAEARDDETYLPFAIGSGDTESLHICKGDGFTSLLRPNADFIKLMGRWPNQMRVTEVQTIQTQRLDDITELPEFDLLKIDVQGSETVVFQNAREKLRAALAIISEVAMIPLYEGQPLLDAQMRELSAQGFAFHKFLFLKSYMVGGEASSALRPRRNKSQAVDGDAVFLRNLVALDDMKSERLKHLAILADAVFHSPDVALLAMDQLADRDVITRPDIDRYVDLLPSDYVHPRACTA
ncbi:MAG: FkbM family methyltransferase [Paracoccaceae bacterium]|nr:FkbM family methyltransferase [Paracoccaceae bacterium]